MAQMLMTPPTLQEIMHSPFHLLVTARTLAHQGPLPMGFSRQEYWSGLPVPPQGSLPDLGTEPASPVAPALAGWFFSI